MTVSSGSLAGRSTRNQRAGCFQRDHHSAGAALEFRASHHQRVPGAQLLLLLNKLHAGAGEGLAHGFRLVANDHVNPLRTSRRRGAQNVFAHQAARQRVQNALDQMWPLAAVSFLPDSPDATESALGLPGGALEAARRDWAAAVQQACEPLGLQVHEGAVDPAQDQLDVMLGEMRYVYATAPGSW